MAEGMIPVKKASNTCGRKKKGNAPSEKREKRRAWRSIKGDRGK